MSDPSPISIRLLRTEDQAAAGRIFRRSFSFPERIGFHWMPDTLVAVVAGQVAGATVLKPFTLPDGRRCGTIQWIFVAPEARGLGVGQALADAALEFFARQGAQDVFAFVEGYNTSSMKLWAHRGFGVLSFGAQVRRYGRTLPALWWATDHWYDPGYFMWVRPAGVDPEGDAPPVGAQPSRPVAGDAPLVGAQSSRAGGGAQWWGTWAANAVVLALAVLRRWGLGAAGQERLAAAPLVLLLFLAARSLGGWLGARVAGWRVRFQAWESGFPLGAALALLAGLWFPAVGNGYPHGYAWRAREQRRALTCLALGGALPTLALLAAAQWAGLPVAWADVVRLVGWCLVAGDLWAWSYPVVNSNGHLLWEHRRAWWAVLAGATLLWWVLTFI